MPGSCRWDVPQSVHACRPLVHPAAYTHQSLHPQGRRDLPLLPLLGSTILLCSQVHTSGCPFSSHTAAPQVRLDVFSSGWRCSWLVGQCPWLTPPLTAAAHLSVPVSWVAAGLERPSSQVYATHFLGALGTPPRLETAGVHGRGCARPLITCPSLAKSRPGTGLCFLVTSGSEGAPGSAPATHWPRPLQRLEGSPVLSHVTAEHQVLG